MSEYGIIGDQEPIDLPVTKVDDKVLNREQQMARFSKTKEFKALKEHLETRIENYRHTLPGGTEYNELLKTGDMRAIGEKTVISSTIIQELQGVIDAYERAANAIKEKK